MYDTPLFDLNDVPTDLRDCFEEVEIQCGAPWVRAVEKEAVKSFGSGDLLVGKQKNWKRTSHCGPNDQEQYRPPQTTGWSPSCQCNAPTRPCVVLDPFSGSGTTALVADRLGRVGIGLELSHTYCEIARARAAAECSLFLATPMQAHAGLSQLTLFGEEPEP